MRRAIERRQEELDDLEDTKCRRRSYALAQRESLPVPLPIPVYPPPKPIPRPPPKTVYRPSGGPHRPNARGYRPSASASLLPTTPEVPSTPPVRYQQDKCIPSLASMPEEPPKGVPNSQPHLPLNKYESYSSSPPDTLSPTPEMSPNLNALQGRALEAPPMTGVPPPPGPPLIESNDTTVIPQHHIPSSTPSSLPPTPPTHHLPPTPTSLSRSNTPTSLTCPRTPTSIRPAPWQPLAPTPLTHKASSSPTVAVTGSSGAYPPTPPSSPSYPGLSDGTPSSSISSSLDQGLNHSRLSLGSSPQLTESEAPPDDPKFSSCKQQPPVDSSYPAILDVMHLNVDVGKDASSTENSSLKGYGVTCDDDDPTLSGSIDDLAKNGGEELVKGLDRNASALSFQELPFQTYKSRFWILGLFSATAFLQSTVWGTFGSIAESAKEAFPSWTDGTIAAFPNWGPIIVVVFTIPMMWITQKLGLRLGMMTCVVLIATATMVRCTTSQEVAFTVLCHVGSILNAFAACLTLSLPAMVAATWFPANERTTATAVGALCCQLGGAAIYMGPLIVKAPTPDSSPEGIRSDIMTLMYIHFGAAAVLLIAVFVYFPAKPPSPPSASSAEEKIDFAAGIKAILKNHQLMLVIVVYSFSFGVPVVWIGVLSFSLLAIDIHQDEAMGVAVTAVLCSGMAAFITARITDKVYGHLKITIIGLLLTSAACFLWFVLLSTKVIAPDLAQVYISVAGGVSFEYATVPLLVELAVELGYPIPESVTGATLTFLFNVVALVFLGLFQIPDIGYIWVSYVLLACVSLTVIPLMFVTETHKRFETDRKEPAGAA